MKEMFDLWVDYSGMQEVLAIRICPHGFPIEQHQDRFLQKKDEPYKELLREVVNKTKHLHYSDKQRIIENTCVEWEDGCININIFEIAKEACPDALI